MFDGGNPRSQIRTERVGAHVTLQVTGAIDHEAWAMWDRCVSDVLDARPMSVTLDLSAITFLASSGMRLIVELRQQLANAGIELSIASVPPKIAHVLQITGLIDTTGNAAP